MNPYDFVPLDTNYSPERRRPVWHNVLSSTDGQAGRLYSGYLYLYIVTETPLFIRDGNAPEDPKAVKKHIRNKDGWQIIPGTSLKGLLRSVVETLCRGCLTIFNKPREYTKSIEQLVPPKFLHCQHNDSLCIACRLFGMMPSEQRNAQVFLGKVNVGDAVVYEDTLQFYDRIYTAVLDTPKPRHTAFYRNKQGYIAGRKFYFHHDGEPLTADRLLEIRNKPGEYRNQYIEPLDSDVEFSARIDFSNLEADEFAALMLATTLRYQRKWDMRHKIGYGKPIGLGSIGVSVSRLCLVDYSARYTALRTNRGITEYDKDEVTALVEERMASLDPQVQAAWSRFQAQPSLQQLYNIWQWPSDRTVRYAYPSQRWFRDNPRAPISATRDLWE
jgi:hypothetical protein